MTWPPLPLTGYRATPPPPIAADGRLYVTSLDGVLTVLATGDKPEVLGRAEFKERIAATPALVDKTIYVRSAENLWAFGK